MALYHVGDTVKAAQEICAALAIADVSPLNESVARYLSSACVILQHRDPVASLKAIEAAELMMEVRRSGYGGTEERIAYDDAVRQRVLAGTLVERQLQAGDVRGALTTADHHRARSLAEVAGTVQTMSIPADVSAPPAESASLTDHVAFVTRAARNALSKWGVAPSLDSAALLAAVAEHARTIILIHPADAQLLVFVVKAGNPPTVHSVVSASSVFDTLGLTDKLRRHLSIALAARAARGELPPQSLEDTVAEFADGDDNIAQPDSDLDDVCRRLFNALFSMAGDFIEPREPIVVVPYRELSVIPLGVLTAPDGRRLADRHAISVLPSIASLTTMVRPQAAPAHAVVVGNPVVSPMLGLASLKGALKEAERVSTLLTVAGMKVVLLPRENATEARFRTVVAGARLVHLACHAALREPASGSPLFLAPSEHDDGLLLPEEIADLQLDAALVVLSACESGLGRATADGVLGIGRAFLRAGARAVLLSLWRVNDDATAYLMRQFYEGLVGAGAELSGRRLEVAAALQRAQIATRNQISDDLSIWGPWLLVGDGGWRLD
jgi:CHAT domain-containing protein